VDEMAIEAKDLIKVYRTGKSEVIALRGVEYEPQRERLSGNQRQGSESVLNPADASFRALQLYPSVGPEFPVSSSFI
jgi:hypothetical protein